MIPDRAPLSGSRWSHTSALSCHPRMVEGVGKWKVGCTSNWCNQQETLVSYGFTWFLVNADRVLLKKIQTPAIQNWMCLTMIAENNYHWKNLDGIVQNWPKIRVFWASSSDQTRNPQRWRTPPWELAGADLGLGILTNFQVREDQVMQAIHAPESHLAPFCLRFWESTPCCCRSGWNFPFFSIFSVAEINPWLLKGLHQLFQKLHGLYHIGVPVRRWNRTSRDHSLRRKVCLVEPTIIGIY
jgi:hypothetical protein